MYIIIYYLSLSIHIYIYIYEYYRYTVYTDNSAAKAPHELVLPVAVEAVLPVHGRLAAAAPRSARVSNNAQ